MQPRVRTRILLSRLRSGRFGRGRRGSLAERFDIPYQLPALGFRHLRPYRHPLSNDTIRQDPENRAGRGALNFRGTEAWPLLAASRRVTMTFSAVLSEENGAGSNGVRIILQRIGAVPCLFGRLL